MRKLGTLLVSCTLLASMVVPAGAYLGSPGRQVLEDLPDPNVPMAPEVVTINDAGVPKAYVRVQNPERTSEDDEYVYIPEDEVPMDESASVDAEAPAEKSLPVDDSKNDETSADGFGGSLGPAIDVSPATDAEMSNDSSGSVPIIPIAGTAGGIAIAWWLLFGLKAFTIPGAGSAAATKVTLFSKLVSIFKHKR